MHIAIDDTYGPENSTNSLYVTGLRRTHVAVVFPTEDIQHIRKQMTEYLAEINRLIGITANEFHFVDIYNRKSPWNNSPNQSNLEVFEFFVDIYNQFRWPVLIQTIDNRTLTDHGIRGFGGKIEDLDLSDSADLSLLFLLIKIKNKFKEKPAPITLFLDEGRKKPGTPFGSKIFHDWPLKFTGSYASSAAEPLLQIADFLAFCINRSTHLAMKQQRSEVDTWFLNLVGRMRINCDDLKIEVLPKNFSVNDFDEIHLQDRKDKGL